MLDVFIASRSNRCQVQLLANTLMMSGIIDFELLVEKTLASKRLIRALQILPVVGNGRPICG